MPAKYVWLRFPRLICAPFLVYARLRGYSHQETVEGHRHGYWDFDASWLMSNVFPWALWLDTFLVALVKIYLPLGLGYTLVCDRFVGDVLVDLMVGLDDPRFDERIPGRFFLALLPRDTQVMILDLDTSAAQQRRRELRSDRSHSQRRAAYLDLAHRHHLSVVSTDAPIESVTTRLIEMISEREAPVELGPTSSDHQQNGFSKLESSSGPEMVYGAQRAVQKNREKYYAVSDSPWLRPVLRHRLGALTVHWMFQGMLYMDATERWFKLGLDLLLSVAIGGVLDLWWPHPLAIGLGIAVAHTLNFVFNGQIWVVLKHFGQVQHTHLEFKQEVERLRMRVRQEPDIVYAAAYGSLARGEWSPTSDLDVRLVRTPGLSSAWRICWFAARERARAFWKRFPLDVFVLDGYSSLNKMSEKNFPVVLGGSDVDIGK
jgi:hypothetical protein